MGGELLIQLLGILFILTMGLTSIPSWLEKRLNPKGYIDNTKLGKNKFVEYDKINKK